MFEVGFQELLLIFVIALVVLGPQKLPGLVAQVGRWAGKARAMARQFREQLESEVNLEELGKAQTKTPPPPSPGNPWDVTPPAEAPPAATTAPAEPVTPVDPPAAAPAATAEPVIATPATGSSPYANPWDPPPAVPDTHEGLHTSAATGDTAPAAAPTTPGHERQA